MKSVWLGRTQYVDCLNLQRQTLESVVSGDADELIFGTEHDAVITLGRRAVREEEVVETHLPVISVERGGLATLHSPGQLVIYPIVHIRERGIGTREWVKYLLAKSQLALESFGMRDLHQTEDSVLSPQGKIVSVGLRVDRGVSFHGLSINVINDLKLFAMIRACGMSQRPLDQLQRVAPQVTARDLFERFVGLSFDNSDWNDLRSLSKSSVGVVGSALP